MTLTSDFRHTLTEVRACFSGLLTFAACVSALWFLGSPCLASDDASTHTSTAAVVHDTDAVITPPVKSDRVPAKEKKKFARYDIDKIGERKVGGGFNLYSLNREREMGQAIAERIDRNVKFLKDPEVTS